MMITMIAAALVAAAPAPAQSAVAQAQPAPNHQASPGHHQHDAKMGEECCCKEMMEKMHSQMKGTHDHQEHSGH